MWAFWNSFSFIWYTDVYVHKPCHINVFNPNKTQSNSACLYFLCSFKPRYIGFSLHHKTNHLFTALYGLTVFILILLLNWLCSPKSFYGEDDDDLSSDEDDWVIRTTMNEAMRTRMTEVMRMNWGLIQMIERDRFITSIVRWWGGRV